MSAPGSLDSPAQVRVQLAEHRYIADHALATSVFLALRLGRPLLLEGEPGVGKTQLAETLAEIQQAELVRLQCYEGIEATSAMYEWNWAHQLLAARAANPGSEAPPSVYEPEFLLERPLLRSLRLGQSAVLLIDELDRADEAFEAFLLETLSSFTITIPELGTIAAATRPVVVISSNRTRDLHDALLRRCLYHWIDYPDLDREAEIIRLHVPEASERLARSVATTVARLRDLTLMKPPGAAEAIDWAGALVALDVEEIEPSDEVLGSLGAAIKSHDDLQLVSEAATDVFGGSS